MLFRSIQREYTGVSLYDYYNHLQNEDNAQKETRTTDSGRTVYGGGGITPDFKIAAQKNTRFQDSLGQHYAFFNFAKHYLLNRHVPKTFEVDEVVMTEFRSFLQEQKIPYAEADLVEVNDWIRASIKSEMFIAEFGQQEGVKVRAETDPQVLKALEMLPKAKELAENAKKIIAQRSGAGREAGSQ